MFFIFLIFAIVGGSSCVPQLTAVDGELLFSEMHNGYNYHVYGKASWFMALEICSANGMRLVRIDDQSKSDAVTYVVDKLPGADGPCWISGSRLYDDTTWSFAIGDPLKYFNWAAGEPNNSGGNERCIGLYNDGLWNDRDCSTELCVLCDKKV